MARMTESSAPHELAAPAPPPALFSRNPLAWLSVFGPGAIIASLTIGTGELIFSSRGGAIFGYRVLLLFVVILVLKWTLVFTTARHMVLTGVHPFRRWMDLPVGPRGWFPLLLFLLAAVCIPIWVSFHAGVLGNFLSWITHTSERFNGGADSLWGGLVLAGVLTLSSVGGYSALERVQLAIVIALLLSVSVALVLYHPDWLALLTGAVVPQQLEYPAWLSEEYPKIAARPVWLETTLYVGVIGGAGYDYLAYTSFLRDKRWGLAGAQANSPVRLDDVAADPHHPVRRWVRAPLIDCTFSFIVVLIFSAVFVASGTVVLGPAHQVPTDTNFLQNQARFVTDLHPWLYPLYVVGVLLTMLGTLYGTLEVAPTVFREIARAVGAKATSVAARRGRLIAVGWCAVGAYTILAWSLARQLWGRDAKPPSLLAILTPANLFTGVLCCGLICLLNPWMDRRFLPRPLRMPRVLWVANLLAGVIFIGLGLKGYWDHSGWLAMGILLGTVALGWAAAAWFAGARHEQR